jgi:hypothetical protein
MRLLRYQDIATFFKITTGAYRGSRTVTQQQDVPVIFLQNTGMAQGGNTENVDADAICYPDPDDSFISGNFNRLEGMFILAPLYGVDNDDGWYRVESVTVNRDHLLGNTIDNIELQLKKSERIIHIS